MVLLQCVTPDYVLDWESGPQTGSLQVHSPSVPTALDKVVAQVSSFHGFFSRTSEPAFFQPTGRVRSGVAAHPDPTHFPFPADPWDLRRAQVSVAAGTASRAMGPADAADGLRVTF